MPILSNIGQEGQSKGVALDLGLIRLSITLSLSGVQSLSDALRQSLQQTEGTLQENVEKIVDSIRQLGVEDLKSWAQQGGQEEKSAFNQLVGRLQEAAQRGQEEAGKIIQKLGGKVEETGEKVQSKSSEETGPRH